LFSVCENGQEFTPQIVAGKFIQISIPFSEIPSGALPMRCGFVDFEKKQLDIDQCKMVAG